MTDGIIDTHVSSQNNIWEVQPIDGNFNQIFNSDDSGDEETFSLPSLPSPLRDDATFSPRIHSPLSLGDPLTSLTLPTLPFATPKHEFSRSFSLSGDSPSEFEKFTGVLDLGNMDASNGSMTQLFSPNRTNIDDLDLRDLILPKPILPASPAPRTPLNLENLLEIDSRSSQEQLQDIINTAASVQPGSSPKASITEVSRTTTPQAPIKAGAVSELTKSAAGVPLSDEHVSKIVNMLDTIISSNQSKVQLSAIPKDKAVLPATTTKPMKPKKPRGNFVPPDSSRPLAKKLSQPRSKTRLKVSSAAPPKPAPGSPASNGYSNVSSPSSLSSTSSDNTSSTLETLASSLGIVRPAKSSPQINKTSTTHPQVVQTVNSTLRVKKTIVKINQGHTQQPIVIGKMNSDNKSNPKMLKKPVVISQIPPQSHSTIRSKPAVTKGPKIVSATIKTGAPTSTNKVVVPYKSPAVKTESKKYVLLPLEKLQNVSPSVISQLGLDNALASSNKRPAAALPEKATADKRIKSETIQPSTSFTEKTQFPINITLPNQTKEKLKPEFTGSIPEMIEKARAKRKTHLSSMSNFTQMENFINEFIQQNNDQVMEILFLKQNNKEINRKYNQLAKLFHTKNDEHLKLKREVEQLGASNKKMEKELKSIKDLIKKYIS